MENLYFSALALFKLLLRRPFRRCEEQREEGVPWFVLILIFVTRRL